MCYIIFKNLVQLNEIRLMFVECLSVRIQRFSMNSGAHDVEGKTAHRQISTEVYNQCFKGESICVRKMILLQRVRAE